MKKIGIIDIGSNSIRLMLIEVSGNYFRIIDEVKETVRLGMGMTEDNRLNPVRIERAIETLSYFKSLCEGLGECELFPVATEAVRRASNQAEFLKLVESKLQIKIKVLSGVEEAYYDYFGVINSMDYSNVLIIDIGGSSTELIWVEGKTVKEAVSLPFGAITITDQYGIREKMNSTIEKELNTYLLSQFGRISWLGGATNLPLIGVGGTIRNIARISRKNTNYPIDRSHNYIMDSADVLNLYDYIKFNNSEQRKKIKGLSKDRSDMFLGAFSVVSALIEFCSSPQLIVSGSGIREGLLHEILHGDKVINDVLEFSINNIIETLSIDKQHAHHVWKLAESLYTQLQPIHKMNGNSYKILKTASLLHDCGKAINFYSYHKHSFYMMASLPINGLTHKELIMAAYTMILSVKENFVLDKSPYVKLLTKEDKLIVQRLGTILRLAESLDKKRNGNVTDVVCELRSDNLFLRLLSEGTTESERKTVEDRGSNFYKLFGKTLELE
ncbi:exopolyphosphatase [Desulfosporosinus hippei]|uniref:Exopolyphosphatase n=1 Tax=Desulfosporosinus hippei DSM 8344 TaxID=1121419 RepID=A0A1G8BE14_9FIRM|nr:exopolyphosphatase [Desulfosporosinus hippei]SDH31466.1 exopolyphosphatase / guanosine-5'-triphosphate,3'-diphosphate pyrophosphatase [Desulfosporosinus hippei DSM 8344]